MKKKFNVEVVNPVFTFWRENKVANEFKVFASDLRQQFQKWLMIKDKQWIEYYGPEQVILSFLTSKDGLNSTFDQSQFEDIYRILRPEFKIHLKID